MKINDLDSGDYIVNIIKSLSEFEDLFLGKELGHGCSRTVFAHKLDDSLAIKIDREGGRANFAEWTAYEDVRNWTGDLKKYKDWLCPCRYISKDGMIMIVDKAEPLQEKQVPKTVPSFLTDQKITNFGIIGKRIVCLDYEFISTITIANGLKMVKSDFD